MTKIPSKMPFIASIHLHFPARYLWQQRHAITSVAAPATHRLITRGAVYTEWRLYDIQPNDKPW